MLNDASDNFCDRHPDVSIVNPKTGRPTAQCSACLAEEQWYSGSDLRDYEHDMWEVKRDADLVRQSHRR